VDWVYKIKWGCMGTHSVLTYDTTDEMVEFSISGMSFDLERPSWLARAKSLNHEKERENTFLLFAPVLSVSIISS
jgi:hypothetical protein